MAGEQLNFDIFARLREDGFAKAGRAASAASDDVMGLARRLDELSRKSATARVELAGNKEAQAQLDKLDLKLLTTGRRVVDPKISIDGAARAQADISGLDVKLDGLIAKSGEAEAATGGAGSGGGLAGAGGMGALIGAGVALSPIIATVSTGLAGFGLAAYGAAAPIMKAAQATGGLKANMSKLDPEQRQLAQSVLGLGKQYHAFEKVLQPEVLAVFGKGIAIAGHLMKDLEPVAAATGKALGGMLSAVDKEFQSGQWTSFFAFMARTAGPDIQLLTNNFTDFMKVLPQLLTDLQPVATGLLQVTDDTLKLTGAVISASEEEHKLAMSAQDSGGWLGKLAHATGQAVGQMLPGIPAAQKLWQQISKQADASSKAGAGFTDMSGKARTLGTHLVTVAADVTKLMTAEQTSLNTQTTYAGDLVTTANDAVTLRAKLKASGDMIGLHTQKERDSFAAANQYITDLGNTATQAYKSGHGVDAAIRAISTGLPILDQAKTKNRAYWEEVKTLTGWLDKLRAERNIRELVVVTGHGTWTMHNPKGQSLPGGWPGGTGAAAGMLVTGGTPGQDSVPILAMPGEAIVPRHLTPAVAPLLKAHGVPGFAAGGIVGSHDGSVSSLGRWAAADNKASVKYLETGLGSLIIKAIRAAQKEQMLSGSGASIARYAEQFAGKVPYQWGGISTSGWDCSGFTRYVYDHFGYRDIPRTSEEQGAWVRRSRAQDGGLAFFNTHDGQAPPSHVGIVTGPGRMISAEDPASGTAFGSTGGAMFFGIPPSGFHGSGSGGGKVTGSVRDWLTHALHVDKTSMGWLGDMGWLVNAESSGNPDAVGASTPSGTAKGLLQLMDGTWAAYRKPGFEASVFDPVDNAVASIRYIHHQYGNPSRIPNIGTAAYKGYDSGVQYLPPGPSLAYNGTGRPERIGGEDLAPLLREQNVILRAMPAMMAAATTRALNGVASRVPAPRASATRGR